MENETNPEEKKDPVPVANAGVTDAPKQPDISGGVVEQSVLKGVPMDHPAIDSNPRKGLPPESSRIDMNDPSFDAPSMVATQTAPAKRRA